MAIKEVITDWNHREVPADIWEKLRYYYHSSPEVGPPPKHTTIAYIRGEYRIVH